MWRKSLGALCQFALLCVLGCSVDTVGGLSESRDCRNDLIGCTQGFTCQVAQAGGYECLPASGFDGGVDGSDAQTAPLGCDDVTRNGNAEAAVGDGCFDASDCGSGLCIDCLCVEASCSDGLRNGDEVEIDCGGATCDPCAVEPECVTVMDCDSGVCTQGECVPASCADGVLNGGESGVDCGGDCALCGFGEPCNIAPDCASGVCLDMLCADVTCDDFVQNGAESDVDCGGASCAACTNGQSCRDVSDCSSGNCADGVCLAPACDDDIENGDETALDCGGSCGPCADGTACDIAPDCVSGVCLDGLCASSSCDDFVQNGDETGLDCGGDCAACADGLGCVDAGDCTSGVCTDGVCQVPACDDGIQNGNETALDCGGDCAACADGLDCVDAGDCTSGVCIDGVCQVPACDDGIQNGNETALDCGGDCAACADGLDCVDAGDCTSGVCIDGVCQVPACDDGIQNGNETALDCGGDCAACADGLGCVDAGDCTSGVCTDGVCQVPACDDGIQNGNETARDCGGDCAACADGSGCDIGSDCTSAVCTGGICQVPACDDGIQNGNETARDCGGDCAACADGSGCDIGSDCTSAVCTGGICQVPACDDGIQNGNETALDCGGDCAACADGLDCSDAGDCTSGVCTNGVCQAASCDNGTLPDGSCCPADGFCPEADTTLSGTVDFSVIHIPVGVNVRCEGTEPLVLNISGDVTIDGSLNADGLVPGSAYSEHPNATYCGGHAGGEGGRLWGSTALTYCQSDNGQFNPRVHNPSCRSELHPTEVYNGNDVCEFLAGQPGEPGYGEGGGGGGDKNFQQDNNSGVDGTAGGGGGSYISTGSQGGDSSSTCSALTGGGAGSLYLTGSGIPAGGSGGGAAGDAGNGFQSCDYVCSGSVGSGGHGGGGGGVIVLSTPGLVSIGGTISANGGGGGVGRGAKCVGGGGGGSGGAIQIVSGSTTFAGVRDTHLSVIGGLGADGQCYGGAQGNPGDGGNGGDGALIIADFGCDDGIQNADETGIDCGGSCPAVCVFDGVPVGNIDASRISGWSPNMAQLGFMTITEPGTLTHVGLELATRGELGQDIGDIGVDCFVYSRSDLPDDGTNTFGLFDALIAQTDVNIPIARDGGRTFLPLQSPVTLSPGEYGLGCHWVFLTPGGVFPLKYESEADGRYCHINQVADHPGGISPDLWRCGTRGYRIGIFGLVDYDEAETLCDDGIQNGDETDIDCGGSCADACAVDSLDYDGFGNWEIRAGPNLGGANVIIEWADGGNRQGNVSMFAMGSLVANCARPPAYWGANHPAFSPAVGVDYARGNNVNTSVPIWRYMGPCNEAPTPRTYNHMFMQCNDNNAQYLMVEMLSEYPIISTAQLVHNNTCYVNFSGYYVDGYSHPSANGARVIVDEDDLCYPGEPCRQPWIFE